LHARNRTLAPHQREIQALLPARHGLWIGTRNGLLFRTNSSLMGSTVSNSSHASLPSQQKVAE
jgi:hypothetical protein